MFLNRLSCAAFAALALSVQPALAGQGAQGRHAKIDRALAEALAAGDTTARVIISVKPGFRDGIRDALRKHGDVITSEHPTVDAIAAVVHSTDISELAAHDAVAYVSADATVFAGAAYVRRGARDWRNVVSASDGYDSYGRNASSSTLRQTLGLPEKPLPIHPTGVGVTVALIDSGIDPRDGFGRRTRAFYDFTRGGIPTQPYDDFGHGTHIAGLIGGASGPYLGVAPDVTFVGLKVLNKEGQGNTSDVIKALEYVIANRARLGVQIVNLSLGHPIFAPASQDPLVAVVERATQAGLIVVTSAGNFGQKSSTGDPAYTGITSPGNAPSALTVGAADTKNTVTRTDDVVAPFSSRGPTWFDGFAKPDVVAPGTKLCSEAYTNQTLFGLLPLNRIVSASGKDYLELSGTSMAAGVATGVVALLVDAHNRAGYFHATPLQPNLVKAMLEFSAIPLAHADALTQGTGEINASGAIALASAIDTGAATGTWWLRTGVPSFTTIGRVTYPWSQQIIWGGNVWTGDLLYYDLPAWAQTFWGDNIVWGTRVNAQILDDNIVWGSSAVWASNVVWADRVLGQRVGDNIVWGTAEDGDNIVWGTALDLDNIVWGMMQDDRIVFATYDGDNIVWGMVDDGDNIVWGTALDLDNIVWGTASDLDNIVWGMSVLAGQSKGIF
jgi:serine protease AprX